MKPLPKMKDHSIENSSDHVQFIALSGAWDSFDRKDEIGRWAKLTSNWCEVLHMTGDVRWVLVFEPVSAPTQRLVRDGESCEPATALDVSDQNIASPNNTLPPNRELESFDGSAWLRYNNIDFACGGLQDGLSPITEPEELTRLDPQWRPSSSSPPPVHPPASPVPLPRINQRDGGRTGKADLIELKVCAPSEIQPTSNGERPKHKLRPPSDKARMAYRLYYLKGQKQDEIAKELSRHFGRNISQGSVSRYISGTSEWISAGNVLPELPSMTKKPTPMDPRELEQGRRLDGRVPRQRDKTRM